MSRVTSQNTGRSPDRTAAEGISRLLALERALRHLKGFDGWVIGSSSLTIAPFAKDRLTYDSRSSRRTHHSGPSEPEATVLRQSKTMARIQVKAADFPVRHHARKDFPGAGSVVCHHTQQELSEADPSVFSGDQMCLLLLRPAAPFSGATPVDRLTDVKENTAGIPIGFSAAEIGRYLELVSDYNSIHQGADAIVPGFLMMNRVLEIFLKGHSTLMAFRADAKFPAPLSICETAYLSTLTEKDGRETVFLRKHSGEMILNMRITYSDRRE